MTIHHLYLSFGSFSTVQTGCAKLWNNCYVSCQHWECSRGYQGDKLEKSYWRGMKVSGTELHLQDTHFISPASHGKAGMSEWIVHEFGT